VRPFRMMHGTLGPTHLALSSSKVSFSASIARNGHSSCPTPSRGSARPSCQPPLSASVTTTTATRYIAHDTACLTLKKDRMMTQLRPSRHGRSRRSRVGENCFDGDVAVHLTGESESCSTTGIGRSGQGARSHRFTVARALVYTLGSLVPLSVLVAGCW